MLKEIYQQHRAANKAEAEDRKRVAELRRQARSGNTKAQKELEKVAPQRNINRSDKRVYGLRSSARHGAKKRRAWRGYLGGKLGD